MSRIVYRFPGPFGGVLALLLAGAGGVSTGALAQSAYRLPPNQRTIVGTYVETPAARLARHVRVLASTPRNFEALIGAGRAALALGDPQAAIGFFGRAEEILPRSPLPKAGTGAALAAMDQPRQALGYFAEAVRLGAGAAMLGADRGLAFDLVGDQARAQADYRAALAGPDRDEARRRLALSLAIGGDRAGALGQLGPLLGRRDPAANRIRALVMALTGDVASARRTVDAAMPGMSRSMEPFLYRLATLPPAEKAAAVHFGHIRDARRSNPYAQGRTSQTATVVQRRWPVALRPASPAVARPPVRTADRSPVRPTDSGAPDRSQARLGTIAIGPSAPVAPADERQRPGFTLPSQAAPAPPVVPAAPLRVGIANPPPAKVSTAPPLVVVPPSSAVLGASLPPVAAPDAAAVEAPAAAIPAPGVAPSSAASVPGPAVDAVPGVAEPVAPLSTVSGAGRLAEIDRLLAQPSGSDKGVDKDLLSRPEPAGTRTAAAQPEIKPPPRSQPKFEKSVPAKGSGRDERAADSTKAGQSAVDRKRSKERAADQPVAKAKPAAKPPGRYWVQLAGGSRVERMPLEYKRIKAVKPALFAKRTAHVAELKGWSRLLVGPFKSEEEAQGFVNELARADIEGFAWTSPSGQPIDKLPAK